MKPKPSGPKSAAGSTPITRNVATTAAVLVVALGAAGCAMTQRPFVWADNLPAQAAEAGTVVQPRDTILVHVRDQLPMSGEFIVREDGGYLQPALGNVQVAGRSTTEIATELQTRLEGVIVKPQVGVSVVRAASIRVNVVGEVRTPGVYELTRDRTLTAALAAAGWLTDFAARDGIFVVRPGDKELRIRFRASDVTAPGPQVSRFRLRDADVVVVE